MRLATPPSDLTPGWAHRHSCGERVRWTSVLGQGRSTRLPIHARFRPAAELERAEGLKAVVSRVSYTRICNQSSPQSTERCLPLSLHRSLWQYYDEVDGCCDIGLTVSSHIRLTIVEGCVQHVPAIHMYSSTALLTRQLHTESHDQPQSYPYIHTRYLVYIHARVETVGSAAATLRFELSAQNKSTHGNWNVEGLLGDNENSAPSTREPRRRTVSGTSSITKVACPKPVNRGVRGRNL